MASVRGESGLDPDRQPRGCRDQWRGLPEGNLSIAMPPSGTSPRTALGYLCWLMVLSVCRRMLHDPCAVEDAFQATFLVLVRKAGKGGLHPHWSASATGFAGSVPTGGVASAIRRGPTALP